MANRNRNPFFDDEEDEDAGGGQGFGGRSGSSDFGRGIGSMQTRITSSRDRTLETQQRALQSIAQSEEMGNATAVELLHQREKLEKADQQLDSIEVMQDTSQRHINNLSSIFGGIKNYFARKKATTAGKDSIAEAPGDARTNALRKTVSLDSERMESRVQPQSMAFRGGHQDARENEIEENMVVMGDGVSRLKALATGLGGELDSQNQLLEKMQPKVDRVNTRMNSQQKDLNVLLHGKK